MRRPKSGRRPPGAKNVEADAYAASILCTFRTSLAATRSPVGRKRAVRSLAAELLRLGVVGSAVSYGDSRIFLLGETRPNTTTTHGAGADKPAPAGLEELRALANAWVTRSRRLSAFRDKHEKDDNDNDKHEPGKRPAPNPCSVAFSDSFCPVELSLVGIAVA